MVLPVAGSALGPVVGGVDDCGNGGVSHQQGKANHQPHSRSEPAAESLQ
jgi:hypothetical protein